MSFFDDISGLFGSNPSDSAQPYLSQIPGIYQQYLNPYIQAGQSALPTLQNQFGELVNNPTAMMNKIGGTYQQSPGYQFQVNQALGAANRAAAAGGMLGSPMEQQNIAGTVNNLANQDYYNYLNHGLNLYGMGLNGLGGINQMGFNAATDMADSLGSNLMTQANLAYAGQQNQNQNFWNGVGAIGGIASMF